MKYSATTKVHAARAAKSLREALVDLEAMQREAEPDTTHAACAQFLVDTVRTDVEFCESIATKEDTDA